jgi:hypothetical protein
MGKCLFNIPPPPGEKVGEWGDIYISPITPHHEFTRAKTNETMSDLFPSVPSKKGTRHPAAMQAIELLKTAAEKQTPVS